MEHINQDKFTNIIILGDIQGDSIEGWNLLVQNGFLINSFLQSDPLGITYSNNPYFGLDIISSSSQSCEEAKHVFNKALKNTDEWLNECPCKYEITKPSMNIEDDKIIIEFYFKKPKEEE